MKFHGVIHPQADTGLWLGMFLVPPFKRCVFRRNGSLPNAYGVYPWQYSYSTCHSYADVSSQVLHPARIKFQNQVHIMLMYLSNWMKSSCFRWKRIFPKDFAMQENFLKH